MFMSGIDVDRNSVEFLGFILDRGASLSESRLPDELLWRWFVVRGLPEFRRYWSAGRKGLGVSVFRRENMGDY
jgi:hypothetical protein